MRQQYRLKCKAQFVVFHASFSEHSKNGMPATKRVAHVFSIDNSRKEHWIWVIRNAIVLSHISSRQVHKWIEINYLLQLSRRQSGARKWEIVQSLRTNSVCLTCVWEQWKFYATRTFTNSLYVESPRHYYNHPQQHFNARNDESGMFVIESCYFHRFGRFITHCSIPTQS